jgi:hypothetical protein
VNYLEELCSEVVEIRLSNFNEVWRIVLQAGQDFEHAELEECARLALDFVRRS